MALVPTNEAATAATPQNDFLTALQQGIAGLPAEPAAAEPVAQDAPEPVAQAAVVPEPEPTIDPTNPLAAFESKKPEVSKLPIEETPEPTGKVAPEDKAGFRIKELKEEITTKWKPLEQTLAQKEARIAELEAKVAQTSAMEEKLAAQEQEMSVVKLESTQAYKEQVAKPMQEVISSAVKLAEKHGIDKDDLLDALEVTDYDTAKSKILALASGLDIPAVELLEMVSLHGKTQPLLAKRTELYANADKALSELQVRAEQESLQKRAQVAEERVRTAPVILEKVATHIPALAEFVKTHGDAIAKTDIDALDLPNRIYNHAAGLALPVLQKQNSTLQSQLDDALDELGKLKKAAPNSQGQRYSPTPNEQPKDFLTAMKQGLGMA